MARKQSEEVEQPALMTLREAAAYAGVTDQRIRTLLRTGRVQATKTDDGHWRVSQEAIDGYNATKGQRVSGKKAYVVRLSAEEMAQLEAFAVDSGWEEFTIEPRYKYDPEKAKAYRQKRAAEQAEAEAEAES